MPTDETCRTRQTLLRRVADRGDSRAWYEFVYHYRGYIYGVARRMGLTHHDAEDVVQQVLLKLADKLPTFVYQPERGRFRGYLSHMTANFARSLHRSAKPTTSLDALAEAGGDWAEPKVDPEIDRLADEAWHEHLHTLAWRTVGASLNENMRKVWEAAEKGQPVAETARETGLAESSIYVYKKRVQELMTAEIRRLQDDLD